MNQLDSYFLAVEDDIFCPPILTEIKKYLNCEQVFIYKLDDNGELENIIYSSDYSPTHISLQYNQVDIINPNEVHKIVKQVNNSVFRKDEEEEEEDTFSLKKAELALPIQIKTPEVLALNNHVSLWGILLIYDFDYLREWSEIEYEYIRSMVFQITIAIERDIIFKRLKSLEKRLEYSQIFDEQTNLINYPAFLDCLDYEWRNLGRQNKHLSLILLDIQETGEFDHQVFNQVSQVVQEEIKRPADIVACYSPSQIIIMLPLTDNTGAVSVNQNILEQIDAHFDNHDRFVYQSSIITVIPQLGQSYQSVLAKVEAPFKNSSHSPEKIHNQNLE